MEIFVKIPKRKLPVIFDTEQEHFIALSLKKKKRKKKEKKILLIHAVLNFFPSKTVPFDFLS